MSISKINGITTTPPIKVLVPLLGHYFILQSSKLFFLLIMWEKKPFWLLIGARKTQVFWHQSEARTAATIWNWSGKTLSPGALLAVLYVSFVPYFSARLDFPSPPLFAPGSPRMLKSSNITKIKATNRLADR